MTSARSGQSAVVWESWTWVRGGSNCVPARPAMLSGHFAVEPGANFFVAVAGRGTRQRRAVQDFLVRPAHATLKSNQ